MDDRNKSGHDGHDIGPWLNLIVMAARVAAIHVLVERQVGQPARI
jgi:hypothetical protein